MFDELYEYADDAFVDGLVAELQSYDIHAPLWIRDAMSPEEVDYYQQLLAPYVLAWILDRMPSCENMVYISQSIEAEIVKSFTPTPTEVYEIEYTVNGWPVIAGMEFEDLTVTRPDADGNAGLFIVVPLFNKTNPLVSPIAAYIVGNDLPEDLFLFIEDIYLEPDMEILIHRSNGNPISVISSPAFPREQIDATHFSISSTTYTWERLSSLQICQFAEAATINGYGIVEGEDLSIEDAYRKLIYHYGTDDYDFLFYCPNFDPDSPMFLLILLNLGYYELVEELRDSERPPE